MIRCSMEFDTDCPRQHAAACTCDSWQQAEVCKLHAWLLGVCAQARLGAAKASSGAVARRGAAELLQLADDDVPVLIAVPWGVCSLRPHRTSCEAGQRLLLAQGTLQHAPYTTLTEPWQTACKRGAWPFTDAVRHRSDEDRH